MPLSESLSDVRVDLILRQIDRESITVEKPFLVKCNLVVSVTMPSSRGSAAKRRRILTLAIQHVQPPRVLRSPVISSFLEKKITLPKASSSPFSPSVSKRQSLPQATPSQDISTYDQLGSVFTEIPLLPAPFAEGEDESKFMGSSGVVYLGKSSILLDPIELLCGETDKPTDATHEDDTSDVNEPDNERVLTVRNFELSYMSLRKGFCTFGGLRVLLLKDAWIDEDGPASNSGMEGEEGIAPRTQARILEEWGVIGELWIKT